MKCARIHHNTGSSLTVVFPCSNTRASRHGNTHRNSRKRKAQKLRLGKTSKYKVPTHCVLQTSFLNQDNLKLFLERKVNEDEMSGTSSMVLELPKRQYLEDENFSKDLLSQPQDVRIVMGPTDSRSSGKQMPKQIVIASTSRFLNENMNLFIEGMQDSDNISYCSGGVPELPERKYLEDTANEDPPSLPKKRSKTRDIPNVSEQRDIRPEEQDKYTPLDPSTQLMAKKKSEPTKSYTSVKPGEEDTMVAQLDTNDYMTLNLNSTKSTDGTYMSLKKPENKRPDSDDDDYEYSYTTMTPSIMASTLGRSAPK